MKDNKKNNMGRRKFLGTASCAALGYTTLFNTLVNLKTINAAAMNNSFVAFNPEYKALVCFLFGGGNDAYNMVIPRGNAEYNEYAATRTNMAIPQNDILDIFPITSDGKDYGFHPAMSGLQGLFDDGNLAVISNVGSLIEPTTKDDYYNGTVDLPLGLYSHSDMVRHWQTSIPHERPYVGWGGKVADLVSDMNGNNTISMNISLRGTNVFQTGENTVEFVVDPYNGSIGIIGYNEGGTFNQLRTTAINDMITSSYQDAFKQTFVDVVRTARDGDLQFSAAVDNINLDTQFSDNYVSKSFEMIAKTIAARTTLDFTRQIFFVDMGGYDNHDDLLPNHDDLLTTVDNAMSQFWDALVELNVTNNVTTFTMSEFSRTLTSNGNGTDHAWGGNVLVMGGDVIGKDMYGSYPALELGGPELVGNATVPSTSCDEYFAELAMWFGVGDSDLNLIFPNLSNFYTTGSGSNPIGFMNV
jgi:uncharacterized protein (DUF1501 family)